MPARMTGATSEHSRDAECDVGFGGSHVPTTLSSAPRQSRRNRSDDSVVGSSPERLPPPPPPVQIRSPFSKQSLLHWRADSSQDVPSHPAEVGILGTSAHVAVLTKFFQCTLLVVVVSVGFCDEGANNVFEHAMSRNSVPVRKSGFRARILARYCPGEERNWLSGRPAAGWRAAF